MFCERKVTMCIIKILILSDYTDSPVNLFSSNSLWESLYMSLVPPFSHCPDSTQCFCALTNLKCMQLAYLLPSSQKSVTVLILVPSWTGNTGVLYSEQIHTLIESISVFPSANSEAIVYAAPESILEVTVHLLQPISHKVFNQNLLLSLQFPWSPDHEYTDL